MKWHDCKLSKSLWRDASDELNLKIESKKMHETEIFISWKNIFIFHKIEILLRVPVYRNFESYYMYKSNKSIFWIYPFDQNFSIF